MTMSREEKRANQEKQLNQICNELQNFGAKYKRPQDGETAQKRRDRINTIGRSIKAAKQKKRIYDQEEQQLERDCDLYRFPYNPPNDNEDDKARRKRLRAFFLDEKELHIKCSQTGVEYVYYTHGEDTEGRRRKLRECISNRERIESIGFVALEAKLMWSCHLNKVQYEVPQKDESTAYTVVRRSRLAGVIRE